MKRMSQSELMSKLESMATENVVIKTLLQHNGHPDKWPDHLKEDLFKRLNISHDEKIYFLNEDPPNQGAPS